VFVVTQMKCGTTWMQQIVYEIAMRGRGNLGDDDGRHIYAVSPWIEASWAVSMEDAPRLGDRRLRLIKSHLPTKLLPIGGKGRYVYVTRHPVACFASCADFIGMLLGPLAPSRKALLDWFCSERMWWGPWPDHVEGWWQAARNHPNVLFLHFEEMRANLPATIDRVAAHLGVQLSPDERDAVVHKSEFEYMKAHEERFSMAPPSPFGETGDFLPSGRADRHADVLLPERARIIAFCRERLRGGSYPLARFYPDLIP
jgi:aryl sulfotransferase